MSLRLSLLLGLGLLLTACGPSPEAIASQTATAATATAASWTKTPTATATATATPTPTPTLTPTPTSSPTATPSPTATLDPARYTSAEGGFSFEFPEGWLVTDFPGLKYKVVVTPLTADFAANIVILDQAASGPLASFVALNKQSLPRVIPGAKIVEEGGFAMASGLEAYLLVVDSVQQNKQIRQRLYFVEAGERKFALTCTRLAGADYTDIDAACDLSVATFRLEP